MQDDILKILADNQNLSDAVKNLIAGYFSLDSLTSSLSDQELGQMVRARLVGLKALDDAFKEISTYRTLKPAGDKVNPAF